jgi:hypothetical protein
MVAKQKKKGVPGTLIRGADGRLYYITDRQLKRFAIPKKHQAKVAKTPSKRLADVLQDIGVANSDSVSRAKASAR